MQRFYAEAGQFWLDDQPQLIQAGEFHYYRAPVDQWEHRLNRLIEAGFNTVATYIPWLWHQPQQNIIDLEGHTHPMRDLAGFLDLATRMGLYIIARPGPYIMAETINEGVPPWVFEHYPHVALTGKDNKPENIVSYLHADFLKCVEGWYQAVFSVLTPRQVTHGGNILMVQLDNEMGMIHWVRNLIDTNPDTLARFAEYLQKTYGDTISERYPTNDLKGMLLAQIQHPTPPQAVSLVEDYRRFFRLYIREYLNTLWRMAKNFGMDTPPVLNIHGFGNGGKTFPIGLSQLVDAIEIEGMLSATDVYPIFIHEGNFHQLLLVNEMTKALQSPDQPLFSIEFQAGGNQDFSGAQTSLYDLHSRLSISCGMRAINHYSFFDGENDPILSPIRRHDWGHPVRKDGTVRRHYARYAKLSRVLNAYGASLTLAQPKTVTTIGFTLNSFMTEINNEFTRPTTDILTHQRDVILFDQLARGLALTHRPFNAVEIDRQPLDVTVTPTLWLMMDKQCEAETQQKIVDYIHAGGRVVIAGRMCSETFSHTPCTILQDALGITSVQSDAPYTRKDIQVFDHHYVPVSFCETYIGTFDEVFARTDEDQTVGFIKQMGKGRVLMFGAALPANTLEDIDIVDQMARQIDCPSIFTLNEWADVRISHGEMGSFLYANNYLEDAIETTISSESVSFLGGHTLSIPSRRGVILPLDWQITEGITLHYITSEVIDITQTATGFTLKTDQADFDAEVSLIGYTVDQTLVEKTSANRIQLKGRDGEIKFYQG